MNNYWQNDIVSKAQIKYIIGLMADKVGYILTFDLANISKGEANNLIQALLNENNEKLVTDKILKQSANSMKNEELLSKINDTNNENLSSAKQHTKLRYKVTGDLHLWGWTDFKQEIEGVIIEYDTTGNIINSITYEVENEIDSSILKKYGLMAIKINTE